MFSKGNKYYTEMKQSQADCCRRRRRQQEKHVWVWCWCVSMKNWNPLCVHSHRFRFLPLSVATCQIYDVISFVCIFFCFVELRFQHVLLEKARNISNKKSNRHRKWFLWTYHKTLAFCVRCAAIRLIQNTSQRNKTVAIKQQQQKCILCGRKPLNVCFCLQTVASSYRLFVHFFLRARPVVPSTQQLKKGLFVLLCFMV